MNEFNTLEKEIEEEIKKNFPDIGEKEIALTMLEISRRLPAFSSFLPRSGMIAEIGAKRGKDFSEIIALYNLSMGKILIFANLAFEALEHLRISEENAEEKGFYKIFILSKLFIALSELLMGRTADGFSEIEKIEKEHLSEIDNEVMLSFLLIKGIFFLLSEQWMRGEEIFISLLLRAEGEEKEVSDFYKFYGFCALSQISSLKENYDKAIEYLKKAIEIAEEYEAISEFIPCKCKLAELYVKIFEYKEAMKEIKEVLEMCENTEVITEILKLILWLHVDFAGISEPQEIVNSCVSSLEFCSKNSDIYGFQTCLRILIAILLVMNQKEPAIKLLENVIEAFIESGNPQISEVLLKEKKELEKFINSLTQ